MRAGALVHRSFSTVCLLAVALLLASCKLDPSYKVGGMVTGLTGAGLVLQNNGGDNLAISSDGPFTFSTALKKGKKYEVTVLTQPSGQTCTVANGSGSISRNVTDVRVTCTGGGFTVGGMVSGLTGAGLVLRNNGGNDLAISADGPFTFSAPLGAGVAYEVTVATQPSGQTCTVSNGTGSIAGANVTNVAVDCTANTFTVGGSVSGLTGAGLVLQNNGSDGLAISGNGVFTFSVALTEGAAYGVTVATQPSGQGCSVTNGSGNIAGANVTNIAVACVAPPAAPTPSLGFGVKELQFGWPAASGAAYYRLLENPDGVSGFAEVATNISALSYSHIIPVHRRLGAKYVVEACNAGGCTSSFAVDLGTSLAQAIGYMKASNTGASDQFGLAVALSGDGSTLAVGAPNEDSNRTGVTAGSVNEANSGNAAAESGAVYVFARVAGAWSQQAYIKASNAGAGDAFGIAVALSSNGDTLAVGARSEASSLTGITPGLMDEATSGNGAPNSGAVYVFTRSAGTWSQQAYVKASNTGVNGFFGNAVAVSGDGDTLAVGATFESSAATGIDGNQVYNCSVPTNCASFSGAVYVFTRSAGSWTQQAYVKASNTGGSDVFGSSVALSGDGSTLAVGAPREASNAVGINGNQADNSASQAGAVYVFTRTAGSWSQQAYVKASNTQASDAFGMSLALSGDGDTLAVGAPSEDSALLGVTPGAVSEATAGNAAANSGAVYVFTRSGGGWSQQAYVKASNGGAADQFGTSVALSADGNSLAVGAPFEDGSGSGIDSPSDEFAADAGAVYVYARSAGAWSSQAYVKIPSNAGDPDRFGISVALDGNGNTLAVGANFEDGSATGIGGAFDNLAGDAGGVYLY
jgi:HJR/Mrr/RecB family endonuclease